MSVTTHPDSAVLKTADGHHLLVDPKNPRCRATQRAPRLDILKDLKEPFAVDIEFQEFRRMDSTTWDHRIGRIAIVNTRGQTIYDTYVRYQYDEDINMKMPPAEFGVTYEDIRMANGANAIREAKEDINKILAGRTVIGHGMRLDMRALNLVLKGEVAFIDTQGLYGQVKLSTLANEYLGMSIQGDFHNPAEDACATMLLYLLKHPYQDRSTFDSAPFSYVNADFPTLASTTAYPSQPALKCKGSTTQTDSSTTSTESGEPKVNDDNSNQGMTGNGATGKKKKNSKSVKGERFAWWVEE